VGSNSEIQGYKVYPILHFCREFSSSVIVRHFLLVTNFIQPYLHQFFDDSHSLNGYGKPSKIPFNKCQSCLKVINIGQDIRQINR